MPNDINIGPITVHMYGIMIAIGFCAAVIMSIVRARKQKLEEDMIYNMLWMCLIGGFLGSRILYYLTVLPDIAKDPSILWDFGNGYVVYGGLIGGFLANLIYFKIKKQAFLPYFDLVIPQVALGQAFGRIGCFFAGCCYGKETTSPIGFTYHTSYLAPTNVVLIPTQVISSILDFILFFALLFYAKRKEAKGTVGALYLLLYSAGRFFVEFLRGDVARGSVGILSTSQFISIIMFLIGLFLYFVFSKREQEKTEKVEESGSEEEKI